MILSHSPVKSASVHETRTSAHRTLSEVPVSNYPVSWESLQTCFRCMLARRVDRAASFSILSSQHDDMTLRSSSMNRSLKTLASAWPQDAIRPKFQFAAAIQQSADRAFPVNSAQEGDRTLSSNEQNAATKMLESLDNLLANKALNQVGCISVMSAIER